MSRGQIRLNPIAGGSCPSHLDALCLGEVSYALPIEAVVQVEIAMATGNANLNRAVERKVCELHLANTRAAPRLYGCRLWEGSIF